MQLEQHSATDFTEAIQALLPPGEPWQWVDGGMGQALLAGAAQEFARVDGQAQPLLDAVIEAHRPKLLSWRLVDYRAVAAASQVAVTEVVPREPFAVGSGAGQRLWSDAGAEFAVPTHQVDVCKPFAAGSAAGTRLWSERGRYVLLVRYYAGVVDLPALRAALAAFKQAHMVLFFVDITQWGGEFIDG